MNISYGSQSYEKTQKRENMMLVSWLGKEGCGHREEKRSRLILLGGYK